MKKEIQLYSRGVKNKLIRVSEDKLLYKLQTEFHYRVGFDNNPDDITFIDPAGGPFMQVGSEIDGFRIKALYPHNSTYGGPLIEFEDDLSGNSQQ